VNQARKPVPDAEDNLTGALIASAFSICSVNPF
jgi:hypothetical protein